MAVNGELQRTSRIVAVDGVEAAVTVREALQPDVAFDLVLVTVLANQVEPLVPLLVTSAAKAVMFMANTFNPVEPLRDAIGAERAVFAFPNMMAFFVDGRLRSVVDGPGMVTTLSSAHWAKVFKDAGFPTEVEPDMTSYLRSHAAMVVPLFAASLLTWQRAHELTWAEARKLAAALREALGLVRGLGHTLKPALFGVLAGTPGFVLTALIWGVARTKANKGLGAFGPGETRALIDAMATAAPGKTPKLLAIRP